MISQYQLLSISAVAAGPRGIDATAFLAAGGLETVEDLKEGMQRMLENLEGPKLQAAQAVDAMYRKHGYPRMATITVEFAEKLKSRNYPNLKVDVQIIPNKDHGSAFSPAWKLGLEYVFGDWKP